MRRTGTAAIALLAIAAGAAQADSLDARSLRQLVEEWTQVLTGRPIRDPEVILPPVNIDPKMAVMPPAGGAMRVVPPPDGRR